MERERVVVPEQPSEGADELSRKGKALSTRLLLVPVLIWMFAMSVPVAQQASPPEAQSVFTDGHAAFALALMVTWRQLDKC